MPTLVCASITHDDKLRSAYKTVGYGTYNAESAVGKGIVYSVGFICILLFGWVLAIAGYLSSAIFDDALVRWQLRRLTWPSLSCVVWGLLYYIWMALIAVATFEYKVYRVGDSSFDMNQGYWFAYISSTTIGLGDQYLDPEVFLYRDLVAFALLLLVGFVLVSAFLSKLVELFRNVYGQHTLLEEMVGQLKSIDMLNETPKEMAANVAARVTEETQKVFEDVRNFGQEVTRESTKVASTALEHLQMQKHENGDAST
jgi:Ion channel